MRILDLRVTPIAMADPPLRSSYGLHAPYALRTIVELVGEDGLVGIAETHGGEKIVEQFAHVRRSVVGRDAFDLTRLRIDVDAAFVAPGDAATTDRSQTWVVPGESQHDVALRVYAALEVAALDLIGRAHRRPVCDLLGGRARDRVPFAAYLFYKHAGGGGEGDDARDDRWGEVLDPDAMVRLARQSVETHGFESVKLKGGVLAPDQEIATVTALREALGPTVPLRIDPNGAWTVETSVEVGTELHGVLEYLEDPTPGLDGMGRVNRELTRAGRPVPLASNVAVTSFADLPTAISLDAVQVVLCDPHYWGGIRAVTELGRMCSTFGLGLSMHSNSHLGISLMAMAHAAAATPHLTYACDTHYPWQDEEDEVLVGGKVPIVDGCVEVTDAPGLGVDLDPDALARGHERYLRCGYRRRDDAAEMRKHVDPSWQRLVPAW